VLRPRPVWRPPVDQATVSTFGRPAEVSGSFPRREAVTASVLPVAPPVPETLTEAFGRPAGAGDSLQRDPEAPSDVVEPAVPADPWRDQASVAGLAAPALPAPEPATADPADTKRYTLRQALLERRLRPGSLVMLLVAALLIGAVGAGIGSLFISRMPAPSTDPTFSLAPVTAAVERPPGSVSDIASKVSPAVVSIEIRVGDSGGNGSGIVIDQAGYILTNNHVASVATTAGAQMSVVFADGSRVPAAIVARDIHSDLAVVKVDDVENLVVAQLGDSSTLAVGDSVVAIGSPLGLSGTVTTGIVSALHRPVALRGEGSDTDAVVDAIQTDASINPGNSGGALVDGTGAVIGINTAIRTLGDQTSSGSIGLGFSIPINYARTIAQQLITTGAAVHSTIGVDARSSSVGTTLGAQVQNVRDGSPAKAAGIQEGDVITKVGDRSVGSSDELTVAVQAHAPGETVPVEISREGRTLSVDVTLAAE